MNSTHHRARAPAGVRLKLAKEFLGYVEADRQFRDLARAAGVDLSGPPDSNAHKFYRPAEMRKIRHHRFADIIASLQPGIPPVVPFRITKGGTGKTTSVANMGAIFAHMGFRVLLIDADAQGSLSEQMGYDIDRDDLIHIGHLLQRVREGRPVQAEDAVVPIYDDGMLDLIPSDITLADESWLLTAVGREYLFYRLLQGNPHFFSRYDVIMVDCAPGTTMMAGAIMAAAPLVTAVVLPEAQSVRALRGLQSNLDELNASVRAQNPIGKHIVVNGFTATMKPHVENVEKLAAKYRDCLNDTMIRSYVGFKREMDADNIAASTPLFEREPLSPGSRDLLKVAHSLAQLYGVKARPAMAPAIEAAPEMAAA